MESGEILLAPCKWGHVLCKNLIAAYVGKAVSLSDARYPMSESNNLINQEIPFFPGSNFTTIFFFFCKILKIMFLT